MKTWGVNSDGELTWQVVDGLDSFIQRFAQRMRLQLGEWFLNTDSGLVDYTHIFGMSDAQPLMAQGAARVALSFPEVQRVLAVDAAMVDSDLIGRIAMETEYGPITISTGLGPLALTGSPFVPVTPSTGDGVYGSQYGPQYG